MKNKYLLIIIGFFVTFFSCSTNPFTGKSTMALVPNSQIFPMSFQQYSQFLTKSKVIKNTVESRRIETIGTKIKVAAERWLAANGHSDYLVGYNWDYNLVENKEKNAWCMPGGKIVFYTGILPICKDDTGIAAVMGHEVAHALANHGQQRMSAGLLQQIGQVGTAVAIGNKDPQTQQMVMMAYGIGSQVGVMLPFSRVHESEADMIGLTLMAIAGYDPKYAVALWERMALSSNGQSQPEILSTHPSNQTRINSLKALLPKARKEATKFGITFK